MTGVCVGEADFPIVNSGQCIENRAFCYGGCRICSSPKVLDSILRGDMQR